MSTALPNSLFTIGGAPCLKWKLAAAFKTHWGWNGFDPTIFPPNKYLTMSVLYTEEDNVQGQTINISRLTQQNWDRLTGAITGPTPPFGLGPGGGFNPPTTVTGDTQIFIDTGVVTLGSNATERRTWRINLSNPYPLSLLDSDTDALINSFDPASVPAQTITPLAYPDDTLPEGAIDALIRLMAPWSYPVLQTPTIGSPMPAPQLNAIAINAYNPQLFPGDLLSVGSYGQGKIVGFLAMAGAYALSTFTVELDATDALTHPIGTPTCVDGRGSCSQWFKIAPPPLLANQESYIRLVPNCRCGN